MDVLTTQYTVQGKRLINVYRERETNHPKGKD